MLLPSKLAFKKWKSEVWKYRKAIFIALICYALAGITNLWAIDYVKVANVSEMRDIFLSNFPAIDLSFLFVWGFLLSMFLLFMYPLFYKQKQLHEIIFYSALLGLVRNFFIILTHLKTPDSAIPFTFPWPLTIFVTTNDLFFSGHTATPFLAFLVFENKKIKGIFLMLTIIMAATVLLMHRHYSIDVLAALFITYGVYTIGKKILKKAEDKKWI